MLWSAPFQDNRPQIHGVVYETGTTRGLAGAEIQLFETPGGKLIATAATDASGAFDFQPAKFGDYLVTADMEGYSNLPVNPLRNGFDTEAKASLDSLHPTREVRMALARPGELTGRIIEDETGKPLVKFRILVAKSLYLNGQLRWWPGRDTVTDEDGQFDVTGLSPGSYVVMVSPQLLSKEQVVTEFSEADLKVVDQDYERSFWPGGHGLDQAFPVPIGSGGTASTGTLRLRRMPFYRVHVSVSGVDCASESKMQVQQTAVSYGMTETLSLGDVPCGQDFLIRNLQPRSYRITVSSGRRESFMHVVIPIEVVDRNLDVRATLAHGAEVDGRVVAAEGAGQPSFENIKISLRGVTPIGFSDGKPLSPDADGKFHIANAPWDGLELFISGIGSRSYYIVRYNGSAVSGNIVAFDSGPTQSMEIVVDDKPAVIAGSVTDGDKPVFQPYVVMVRWPASTEDVFSSTKNATGDEDGKFQFAGLAPGEYRVLAFSEAVKDKLDEPHVLERLLSGAEKVTLERGGFQNVALKLTNPTR